MAAARVLRPKEGKTHFVVMDFRNVTRLFADPDWDGPIEIDDEYTPKKPGAYPEGGKNTGGIAEPPPEPYAPKANHQ